MEKLFGFAEGIKNQRTGFFFLVFFLCSELCFPQLKFVAEDFEGFADGVSDLKPNGIFTFGNISASVQSDFEFSKQSYSGRRNIRLTQSGKQNFGGWGKGIGLYVPLDAETDYLNFYVTASDTGAFRIELQEDDNGDGVFEKDQDDAWSYLCRIKTRGWQLVSVPLNQFKDGNDGGDGVFNSNYGKGKLFVIIFSFIGPEKAVRTPEWIFDFICFSRGTLPTGKELFSAPPAAADDFCILGTWSKEGNLANFSDIPSSFEKIFNSQKKIGVAHFFQPFSFDGGTEQNLYPSVERVNKVIREGYIPMITLEDHFANTRPNVKQPNLYSIVEGHFDSFFIAWAKEIRQVNGTVLLRILHEFNGDWYPWCLVNNDNRPELLVNAFRHIRNIFYAQDARNVKFIWCPNSMSVPQEQWNYILDAYPGNEWVDFVGLDIYNGAGKSALWRSFRKEGMENYFLLTQQFRDKPLLICEVASRERKANEPGQSKGEWICQMGEALGSDMSKVRLLCWFNEWKPVDGEKKTFPVDSSPESKRSFLSCILNKTYFQSGAGAFKSRLLLSEQVGQK